VAHIPCPPRGRKRSPYGPLWFVTCNWLIWGPSSAGSRCFIPVGEILVAEDMEGEDPPGVQPAAGSSPPPANISFNHSLQCSYKRNNVWPGSAAFCRVRCLTQAWIQRMRIQFVILGTVVYWLILLLLFLKWGKAKIYKNEPCIEGPGNFLDFNDEFNRQASLEKKNSGPLFASKCSESAALLKWDIFLPV
jgi:hypothetical protein